MSTDTLVRPTEPQHVLNPTTGDGDHDRFAHYVPKDRIVAAAVSGEPITALCGKVWVPNRDPERYPVCPECKDAWERLA